VKLIHGNSSTMKYRDFLNLRINHANLPVFFLRYAFLVKCLGINRKSVYCPNI
jgi:hypothetical protein